MRKFFLPVCFTYSTRVTKMPALPEMNRPGSIKMRSPSGLSRGASAAAYEAGVRIFLAPGRLPPAGRPALQRRLVNDAQAAADAEKFQPMPLLQPLHQGQHFFDGLLERLDRRQLRADVHLQPAQLKVLQSRRARVNALDVLEGDAEFVFVRAGGDLGVGARIHAGVHAHRDGRGFFEPRGNAVDAVQFRLAFHVEGINAPPQREFDFRLRFAHAGEDTFARLRARRQRPAQFALAHDVKAAAERRQRAQHGLIRIGLHREADEVVQRRERAIQFFKMLRQRPLRIDIERRPVFAGQRFHGHALAIKLCERNENHA